MRSAAAVLLGCAVGGTATAIGLLGVVKCFLAYWASANGGDPSFHSSGHGVGLQCAFWLALVGVFLSGAWLGFAVERRVARGGRAEPGAAADRGRTFASRGS